MTLTILVRFSWDHSHFIYIVSTLQKKSVYYNSQENTVKLLHTFTNTNNPKSINRALKVDWYVRIFYLRRLGQSIKVYTNNNVVPPKVQVSSK